MTIKDIKTEFKLTNKRIADDLKIPLVTVEQWSAGVRKPPEYLLLLIREHYQNKKETSVFEDIKLGLQQAIEYEKRAD